MEFCLQSLQSLQCVQPPAQSS